MTEKNEEETTADGKTESGNTADGTTEAVTDKKADETTTVAKDTKPAETTVKADNPKTGDAVNVFPIIVFVGSAITVAAGMKKVRSAK